MSKTFTFEAIGTHWWIEIFDHLTDEELEMTKCRFELISSEFDRRYSRFREDSQVTTLNRYRVLQVPTKEFRDILIYGKQLYLRSHTTFNLLSGHILEARGYDAHYTFEATTDVESRAAGNPLTDLLISDDEISLRNGNIDIGGYGKGWLIDVLADDLKKHNLHHFLINGGGDMYATCDTNGSAISIYLEHPIESGTYLLKTTLCNQGFAASSPFKRSWKSGNKLYDHVVTKGTTPQIASFVKADKAVEADAFATVAMLLPESSLPDLAQHERLAIARFDPLSNELWQTLNFSEDLVY
jgi:FAD:protein FMN transferase